VQALANLDQTAALKACDEALAQHPLSAELHYLHAVLLVEVNQHKAAAEAARRLVFLDRSLAIGHFLLGSILRHQGDVGGARRSFRNARDLCAHRPADEPVPLTEGEVAGRLVEAADLQLAGLSIMKS
jgi:chemotaxis protein methyltransferase CheR